MSILGGKQNYEPKLKDTVIVKTAQGRLQGSIRYIGALKSNESTSTRYGIELVKPMGDHNGTYKGHQYFTCTKNHGIIVKRSAILKKVKSERQSTSHKKLRDIVQKPMKIPNQTFNRIEKVILGMIRTNLSTNSALIESNVILLIYIYCDPYDFTFIKECTENTIGEISIHNQGLTLSNLNDNGGFGIILLGDNAVFPMTEWNLVDIADGNVMEYECSLIMHRMNNQNGNIYISNGYFGVVVVSQDFYHFCSLKGMNKKTKGSKKGSKSKAKVESKVHHIIHDHNFNRNCLVIPPKYYGDIKPICTPFDFPYKKPLKVKVQCKKSVRKGTKTKIEWDSRIIIETTGGDYQNNKTEDRKFEFIQSIGNRETIGRFRVGLLLYAPDAECSGTWMYRCKASVEAQQVTQLCNIDF